MADWGQHGAATRDLWDVFFRTIQQPTAAFASGTSCPTIQFDAYVQRPQLTAVNLGFNDQTVIDGGNNMRALTPEGANLGSSHPSLTREVGSAISKEMVQTLVFPWQFYRFAQDYLLRLQTIKPPSSAPIEQRMIWAVDASWWLNMMFAAWNAYPTWVPNALGLALDSLWTAPEYIPSMADVFANVEPFRSLHVATQDIGGFPYRVPFAGNPGELDSQKLLKNRLILPGAELTRIQRFATVRPWWLGIQTFAAYDEARATREDPQWDANLLRAVAQHTLWHFPGGLDFFATVEHLKSNVTSRQKFDTTTEKLLPAWISVMTALPYWGMVRASIDSWRKYATQVLSIAQYPGQPEEQRRFPYTATEIHGLHYEWEKAAAETRGMLGFSAQIQTMLAIVQAVVTASVGRSQLAAFQLWYQYATFRYNEPKSWERGWEIQPMLLRQVGVSAACDCLRLYPEGGGRPECETTINLCDSGPDARLYDGGFAAVHADQSLSRFERLGGLWLTSGDTTREFAADLEKMATPPVSLRRAAPDAPLSPPLVTSQATRQSNRGWLIGAALFSLVGGGIIFATRKR